jgi:HEPN domain-containing protein
MNIAAQAQLWKGPSQKKELFCMSDKEFVLEWIQYASNDLISTRHLFEDLYPKQTNIATYLSHQCAEKALKAFLVAHDIEPPKIHDLDKLVKLCQNMDSGFSQIQDDSRKMNPYGVASHYPKEIFVDETIAKTVIERSQRIYDFCIEKNKFFDTRRGIAMNDNSENLR